MRTPLVTLCLLAGSAVAGTSAPSVSLADSYLSDLPAKTAKTALEPVRRKALACYQRLLETSAGAEENVNVEHRTCSATPTAASIWGD